MITTMKPALLLVAILMVGGCATKQPAVPAKASGVAIPMIVPPAAPAPVIITPPAPEIKTLPAQPSAPKDALDPEAIKEQGQQVEVISNPPGATIALNDKVLGVAPGKFFVVRKPNRYGFLPRMTITATPPAGAQGQHAQSKLFDGYTQTPEMILFDMRKPAPIPRIEGELE